jgi:hypothetical protein
VFYLILSDQNASNIPRKASALLDMPLQSTKNVKITIRDSSPPQISKFPYNPKNKIGLLDRTPSSNNSPIIGNPSRANSITIANENINSSKLNLNNSPTSSYRAISRANVQTPLNVTSKNNNVTSKNNLKLVFLLS